MKKIYSAPTCGMIPLSATYILAGSGVAGTGEGITIPYGGEDDGEHEGESNIIAWDRFDNNF